MPHRVTLGILFLLLCATSAWPKWKEEDQKYLDDQFKAVQDQVQTLATQVQSLNAQLTELRQNQAQVQAVIIRQARALQDIDQMVSSIRLGGEENFSNLKALITQLRNDTQASFAKLTGQPAQLGGGTAQVAAAPKTPVAAPAPRAIQGYVTSVEGDNVMIDLGSGQGIQPGSRLVLYKATDKDLTTRVGVIEIIQVLDAGNSRAKIINLNAGVQPEFSDIVRLE